MTPEMGSFYVYSVIIVLVNIKQSNQLIQSPSKVCSSISSGGLLPSIDFQTIDNALSTIQSSYKGRRSCAISLVNKGPLELTNPQLYFDTGNIQSSPPYSIQKGNASMNLVTKQALTFRGSAGVITYDIENSDYVVAIMWNVPLNTITDEVSYNMKIYPKYLEVGSSMFIQMMNYAGKLKHNGYSNRVDFGVKFTATMTQNTHSKLIVWINTEDFNENAIPHIHKACAYYAVWPGNFCWRECIFQGYCWTDATCGGDQYCNKDLECSNDCVFS